MIKVDLEEGYIFNNKKGLYFVQCKDYNLIIKKIIIIFLPQAQEAIIY